MTLSLPIKTTMSALQVYTNITISVAESPIPVIMSVSTFKTVIILYIYHISYQNYLIVIFGDYFFFMIASSILPV